MLFGKNRREKVLVKELALVEKQEKKLEAATMKGSQAAWKAALENKIPAKVYTGLQSAFCKGFGLVFDKGRGIIEKSYNKEQLQAEQSLREYAVQLKGGRREIKQVYKGAKQAEFANLAVTTVEGLGLGALGIGLPDIVLFLSTLLRGVYSTALNYGFGYESRFEQMLILKMLSASLAKGEEWQQKNEEIDRLISAPTGRISPESLEAQIQETASAFAVDMLLLKFIQGLPLVGIIGGAANPIYYKKIMQYVQLKYKKRYLLGLR